MKKLCIYIISFVAVLFLSYSGTAAAQRGEYSMKIKITSQNMTIIAQLNNSATSKDLIGRLPLTLNLHQHQNREYYADIRLDKDSPSKGGYKIGEIAYWAPGNNLVLFYGKGYTGNLISMGQIISGLEQLPQMGDSFTARFEIIKE